MSFDSDFYELQKKKKKKTTVQKVSSPEKKTSTVKAVSSPLKKTTSVTGKKGIVDEREIAPVMKTFEPKKTTVTAPERKSTAIAKAILGTAGDLGMNAASGAVGHIESITDAVGYGAADIADKIGKGSLADRIREKTKESFTQKLFGDAIKTYGEHSLSGDFTDSVAQSIGQVGTSILGGALSGSLLGGLGIGKRAVEKAVSAITTGATAMSGFGSGVGQAYEGGATDEEAKKYGMIAGASEALTELLFGGMGKVSKALGHSKGLLSLDDMLAKKVSNIFSNQIVKNIAEFGVKASGETFEEILAGMAQVVGKKITYMKDEDFLKILKDEELLEQGLVALITSSFMQSGDFISSAASKTDFITGLDQNEQKVVDKAVENRIAEAGKDGKKLSKKDKDKIYDEVRKALDEGDIDTDIIESTLGGEKYESYKNLKDKSDTFRDKVNKANSQLQQKYDELQKEHDSLNSNNLEEASRQSDIKQEQAKIKEQFEKNKGLLKELDADTSLDKLKANLGENVSDLVKDSRLAESYNEKARRKEAFKADLSKYDAKQQEVIKKAAESGILNNTRKTHRFVDFIAKISADKGVSFDFTSNEKLKESGFAIEGRTVNGLVTKDGIQINVNSAKALNTVVGHEVMHIFEGTELYPEIQRIVKEVAVKKGEYQSRYDEITAPTRESIAEGKKKAITDAPIRADVKKKFPMVAEEAAPALTDKQIADMQREDREAAETLTDADMPPEAEATVYSADTIPLNKKTLKNVSDVGRKILMLNAKEKRSLTELIQRYSTSEDMDSEALFGEIKKLFGEKSFTERIEEVANVRQALSGYRIGVSSYIKNGISDYAEFRKRNFGKLFIANNGIPVDTAYMELSEAYPDFFPSDIVNPTDQLLQMAEVANMERDITNTYEVDDDVIREATETIGDMVGSYQEKQLIKATEREGKAILRDEERRARREQSEADKARRQAEKEAEPTRSKLHKSIVDGIKAKFTEKGFDFDEVLKKAKNIGALKLNDNTPQRAIEKTLGYKPGQILADATVNKAAQNETEGIKWLNSYLDRKNGILAQISKQYGIKPGSKESAAAQKYAEGFYVDEKHKDKPIYKYDDAQLAKEFPDLKTQERIKGLAKDERIRKIYDETLEKINESRKRNLYPEIPRRDNYFLHFRAMGDTFSTLGLPFNPNDIRAKDLPTDINGITADLKPGQPYFPSANERKGIRTSFDLLGGLEQYLTSAKNQIYHIDDIQNLRAVRNYLADSFGQNILDNLDTLSDEEVDYRIEQVYKSHLSNFARFLNEEANVLAGKTALIDRGLEGFFGRRGMTFLKTLNGQVGANMVGFNISSSLTNFLPVAQALAKTNKADFTKAFVQMSENRIKSIFGKETDGFAENSPVIIRRKGAEQFYRKPYQKIGDMGYLLMSAVDNVSTELIARTKFNEFTRKGMDEQTAHFETDKWVSRLMGDRSLGQQPLLYNSKTLGIITKFQLEVRIQLDSLFYDTIQEAKLSNEEIENKLLRNAKTAAQVTSTFVQLAILQHIFGQAFERVAGYNPAFDIIEVLAKTFGFDDDEEDEDTVLDNFGEGLLALLEDLPYTSTFTGGRIPISSALPSWENIEQIVKGEDESGNKKSRLETAVKVFDEVAPYYILPGGAGQIKKTAKGLKMFDDDLPIAGSYTESGKLRFPVEETPWNVAQAAVFGQYANENAREYFDEGYAPLNEKQTKEFIDSDLPIADYWKYRKGLSALKPEEGKKQVTLNQKGDYIGSLDLPTKTKNVLINSIADRETPIDMKTYGKYKDFEEFDFATKNPEKYKVLQEQGISVKEYKEKYEKSVFMYTDDFSWAAQNPESYALSKAVTDNVTEYRSYTSKLYEIRGDKDSKGNTISGSTKKKKKAYIWSLDLDWGAKYVLLKKEYPKDDTYNSEIIDYVNKSGLSYNEKVTVFEELGFKVKK